MSEPEDTSNTEVDVKLPLSPKDSSVTRYSKEILLALHDSPLVTKPEGMPPLSSWFGDETNAPISKNILNGIIISRASVVLAPMHSLDKSIILGPTKTNFASSLYGGLKRSDEASSSTPTKSHVQSPSVSRQRHNDDTRLREHHTKEHRILRGTAYPGEKGFHRDRGIEKQERRSHPFNGQYTLSPTSATNKRHHHDRYGNRVAGTNESAKGRRDNVKEQQSSTRPITGKASHSTPTSDDRTSERLPEWMDYNPNYEPEKGDSGLSRELDMKAEFANDLEVWKSNMKQRDMKSSDNSSAKKDDFGALPKFTQSNTIPKGELGLWGRYKYLTLMGQIDTPPSGNIDELLAIGSIDLTSALGTPQHDGLISSFFDASNPSSPYIPRREPSKGSSRFAKFFAQREESTQEQRTENATSAQPRSISLEDLFQGQGGQQMPLTEKPKLESTLNGMDETRKGSPSPAGIRMLSEAEVLQTLGAQKSSSQEQPKTTTNDNAMGFNRVLQILSQPKPTVPPQPSSGSELDRLLSRHDIDEPKANGSEKETGPSRKETELAPASERSDASQGGLSSPASIRLNALSPKTMEEASRSPTQKPTEQARTESNEELTAKPKAVSNLFGGNLPTSVLRQMSARSSEGRSPSMGSNKSTASSITGRHGSNTASPSLSSRSPATVKLTMTSNVMSNSQQQPASSPGTYPYTNAYQRMPPSSGYPLPGGGMSMDHPVRSFDQLLQYGEGVPSVALQNAARSGMNGPVNPMMAPPISYAQQQPMEQFMPPHMMPPMMPPMPMRPMMPPHHIPPHLQGRFPAQRDILPPNESFGMNMANMLPHVVTNGKYYWDVKDSKLIGF
ncbi:hypothetical protein EC973_005571 [Apophysomyces ossiformis]|uniref:Uncharacterized protein n=1 Tax=Apophysomyces ossiformis TaxID=679940 RepID=A0A8H7BZ93_9FUNG|nr:hypothetical protein EC973_005571 [Apophysomyces ossiformis]